MDPIIALDFEDFETTQAFLAQFDPTTPLFVKVGMELFYREGPAVIKALQTQRPVNIFLDLKLHDIPHTVEKAAYQLGRLGIQLTTVHAAGGSAMLKAAKAGLQAGAADANVQAPKLLAITHLTSSTPAMLRTELSITTPLPQAVQHLAAVAQAAGVDGVVASAQEVPLIRGVTAPDFLIITPGIRPAHTALGDQKRVVTPKQAHELGSSGIVVGRPIIQASDPIAAYQQIKAEWSDHQ